MCCINCSDRLEMTGDELVTTSITYMIIIPNYGTNSMQGL